MKQILIMMFLVIQGIALFAQQEKREIHKGNQLYNEQKYTEAEASYRKSLEKSKQSVAGNFNLGDAFYKQKKFDKAAEQFNGIASSASDPAVKAQAYHNLGNTLMESKKYEESIEVYKKSLLNNPKDDQTRYNLAYAMEKLKQQQQQNKDKKNKDKKDQKNKDQKDKDKNKDDKNKDDKNKDNKDQKDKDKKDQNKDQDKKDQDKKDQDQKDGQKPQPDKLSKEDAKRMLEALNNEEKNTQDKLKNKKATGVKGRIKKDW